VLLDGSPFAGLVPLPKGGKPLSKWSDLDEPLTQIVSDLRLLALNTARPA
jgi:hypothetical protein